MEIVAKCPQCDAGLPVNAADAPAAIKCGGCGRDIALSFSDPVKSGLGLDRCPVCGLSHANNETGDGPAFFIMLPLCLITAGLALVFERTVMPPAWVHVVIWPIFIALAVGFALRPVKALMAALQYKYRDGT